MGKDARRNHAAHPGRLPKPDTTQAELDAANLRFFGSQIVDLEHFEAVIAGAKPEMRAYVRRLLAGYVPFAVPEASVPVTLSHFDDPRENTPEMEDKRRASRGGLRILHVDSFVEAGVEAFDASLGPLATRLLRYDDNGE
jgi:hypothetical protein